MRVSQDEKDRSHQRIVEAAARLMRERGIEGTGVAEVMSAAGMTHGGFYRHFDGKDALLAAALEKAFDEITSLLDLPEPPATAVTRFETRYLSADHIRNPGLGCPVAALAGDIARAAPSLRSTFTQGVHRLVSRLAGGMKGAGRGREDRAMRRLAMLAGAVMLARATDDETGNAILAACRTP